MMRTCFLRALLVVAAVASTAAHAGMSGTSDRIEQQSPGESRAAVQPQARGLHPKPSVQQPSPLKAFDGPWAVTSSPGCGLAKRSGVRVSRGRIVGQGLNGSIDADGNVHTIAHGGGVSVVSTGTVSGGAGSGTYKVSNGCTGTWVAHKS